MQKETGKQKRTSKRSVLFFKALIWSLVAVGLMIAGYFGAAFLADVFEI